jgi:hypothetical protein
MKGRNLGGPIATAPQVDSDRSLPIATALERRVSCYLNEFKKGRCWLWTLVSRGEILNMFK